jgi:hypothetical protein
MSDQELDSRHRASKASFTSRITSTPRKVTTELLDYALVERRKRDLSIVHPAAEMDRCPQMPAYRVIRETGLAEHFGKAINMPPQTARAISLNGC